MDFLVEFKEIWLTSNFLLTFASPWLEISLFVPMHQGHETNTWSTSIENHQWNLSQLLDFLCEILFLVCEYDYETIIYGGNITEFYGKSRRTPYKNDGALVRNFEKNPWEVPTSCFVGVAEIVSPIIGINSKTPYHMFLLSYYFLARYPKFFIFVLFFATKTSEQHTATADPVNFFIFSLRVVWTCRLRQGISDEQDRDGSYFIAS